MDMTPTTCKRSYRRIMRALARRADNEQRARNRARVSRAATRPGIWRECGAGRRSRPSGGGGGRGVQTARPDQVKVTSNDRPEGM